MFSKSKKSQIPPVDPDARLASQRDDLLGGHRSSAPSVASGYSRAPPSYTSQSLQSSRQGQPSPSHGYGSNAGAQYAGPSSTSAGYGAQSGYTGYRSREQRSQGAGGWGSGASAAQATEGQRSELFKGAKATKPSYGAQDLDAPYDQYGRGANGEQAQDYANEDDEVEAIKQQIRFTKQESLASTRNALRTAQESEEVARATLTKLGDQSERIANTERSIDMAKAYNDRAIDEAREIKRLNRSIFRPTFTFNKQAKRDAEERRIINRHLDEREEREEVRRQVAESRDRIGGAYREMDKQDRSRKQDRYGGVVGGAAKRLEDRQRYQFEADEEDDEVEAELDSNLDEIGNMARRLKLLATAAGDEVAAQNKKLGQLSDKTDRVDTAVFANTQRLARIK